MTENSIKTSDVRIRYVHVPHDELKRMFGIGPDWVLTHFQGETPNPVVNGDGDIVDATAMFEFRLAE